MSKLKDLISLESWPEKYEFLIELGSLLPDLKSEQKNNQNLVLGCTSRVWLISQFEDGKIKLQATSDSLTVKGLLSIILELFNDKKPVEIMTFDAKFISEAELDKNLSLNRIQGMQAIIKKIKLLALSYSTNVN